MPLSSLTLVLQCVVSSSPPLPGSLCCAVVCTMHADLSLASQTSILASWRPSLTDSTWLPCYSLVIFSFIFPAPARLLDYWLSTLNSIWFLKVIFFFGQAEENPVLLGLAMLLCLFVHSRNYHVTWQKCDLPPAPKITLISAGNRAECTLDTVVMHPLPKAGKWASLQFLDTFSALRVLLYILTQAIVKICF